MAIGLGFANPELKRAQMLAQLNGSTRLPMNPGSGPPPVSAELPGGPGAPLPAAPQAPQAAPQAAPQIDPSAALAAGINTSAQPQADPNIDPTGQGAGMPKWAKIAGAIGHVLLSIDAGYHGRGMPGAPDYLDPQKEQDQNMQVAEFLVNTTARAWEVSRKAPPGARGPMLEQFKQAIQRVAPDFDFDGFLNSMQTDAERMDELAPDLATLSEDAKRMVMAQINARGGNANAAAGVIKDQQFMAGVMDFEDDRNTPALRMKLQGIQNAMKQLGMPPDALADASPEGFRQFNGSLPEKYRLSPSEIGTLRRNGDLQRMIGLGQTPQERGEDPTLESRAGRRPPPEPLRRDTAAAPEDEGEEPFDEPVAPAPPRRRATPPTSTTSAAPPAPPSQGQRPPQGQAKPRPGRPGTRPPPDEGEGNAFLDEMVRRGDEGRRELQRRGVKAEQFVPQARQASNEMNRYLEETGADRYPVEEMLQQRPEPAPQQARRPARGEQPRPEKRPAPQRFTVPNDMSLPGVGKVKKGDAVIYDQTTGKYRRG